MNVIKILIALILTVLSVTVSSAAVKESFTLTAGGREYTFTADNESAAREIFAKLPESLTVKEYAGHEYFVELPFRPDIRGEATSKLKAGHIYYWGGGNSFVLNYEDCDIAPYSSLHIGAFDDAEGICEYLRSSGRNITVSVK